MPTNIRRPNDPAGFRRGYAAEGLVRMRSLRFGLSTDMRRLQRQMIACSICISCTSTPYKRMSDHAHDAEDNPSHRERHLIDNLANVVEHEYEHELASLPSERSDPSTWEQALEQIREDAIGFIKQEKFRKQYRDALRFEAGTDRKGTTRRNFQQASAWCKEVLYGLNPVPLDPHFDDACPVRVLLLYLKNFYRKQVPRHLYGDDITWRRAHEACIMMVSLCRPPI